PPYPLFLYTATATTEIYTLSLHDALPISTGAPQREGTECALLGFVRRSSSHAVIVHHADPVRCDGPRRPRDGTRGARRPSTILRGHRKKRGACGPDRPNGHIVCAVLQDLFRVL